MSTLNTYNLKSPDSANTNLALDASGNVAIQAGSASAPSIYVTGDTNTGLYSPGADQVAVTTGGTARLFVDASGRLLVGTSSTRTVSFWDTPQVQIEGLDYQKSSLSIYNNQNEIYGAVLSLGHSRGTSVGSNTVLQNNDYTGVIAFYGSDGSNESRAAEIAAYVDGTPGTNDMPGRLVFSTTADGASSPTEAMRITSDQRVFIGAANNFDGGKVEITQSGVANGLSLRASSGSFANDVLMVKADRNTTNATFNAITYYNLGAGAQKFRVQDSGNVNNTNNVYSGISDIKLKENVVDARSQWNDIKTLRPVNYNFKAETGQETHTQIGLVAQEVELVSPGLVSESPDRDAEGNDLGTVTKSVNYSVLYMKAVKALQEAMERIETLEAKVAALESA